MPSSYTPSLRLVLPVTGELVGTWGDTVNAGLTNLVDAAIAGTAAVAMSDANYTLTAANEAADEARQMFIRLTGTLSATRNVVCPTVSKLYFVSNQTTGGQSIVFKTLAGSGITVANGQRMMLYCDGTNVVEAITVLGGTATNATNINISATTSSDTTTSVVLVGNQATGNQSPFIDSGLTYNANTDTLTVTNLAGNAATVTNGVYTDTAQTITGAKRGAVTTDNDLSFDLSAGNNFQCATAGAGTLTFTNLVAGQSGFIKLTNASNHTISAAASTKIGASTLTTISATGVFILCYFCDGTNVYVLASGDLT